MLFNNFLTNFFEANNNKKFEVFDKEYLYSYFYFYKYKTLI